MVFSIAMLNYQRVKVVSENSGNQRIYDVLNQWIEVPDEHRQTLFCSFLLLLVDN